MTNKYALIFIILLSSSNAFACECANVFNNSFLGNTERFDFIVKGKIDKEDFDSLTLIIEETYKGEVKGDTINLIRGGLDCRHSLDFKLGENIIFGLVRSDYEDLSNAFMAPGCVTSAIYVEGQKAYTPEYQPPMFKKPKIEMFRSRMRLKALEKKIKRKVS